MKSTNVEETIDRFWDMFIVDALIGNFDRHGGNWGFIKKDNQYRVAPVYDNGSSLYPKLNTDEKLEAVLSSEEEIDQRIYKFPTSHIKVKNRKSSYFEVISSLQFEACNDALKRIVPRIDFNQINTLIDEVEGISEVRKRFYKVMLQQRYEKIIYVRISPVVTWKGVAHEACTHDYQSLTNIRFPYRESPITAAAA